MSSSTAAGLADLLLSPALWLAVLGWRAWRVVNGRYAVAITGTYDKTRARAGQLFSDGNPVTSKVESRIRRVVVSGGFRPAAQGTAIHTVPDHNGRPHKYTPDIICPAVKLIVEVDPEFTHSGAKKIADDLLRNQMYAASGYRIVRVRMGGARALGPYDLVIPGTDWNPEQSKELTQLCRRARWVEPRYWEHERVRNEEIAAQEKTAEAERKAQGGPRPSPPTPG